jgi:Domain of unknown function (DUF4123)
MPNDNDAQHLILSRLIQDPELSAFAVLDGASIPDLISQLYAHEPEHLCLYRGPLEPDLAETAPYLVRLQRGCPFTEWVLEQGWGKHWGIFCCGKCDLRDLRSHFRRLLIVYDPAGSPLYFRFYDPRVLGAFLPTCTNDEVKSLFGPLASYFAESDDGSEVQVFRLGSSGLVRESLHLPQPESSGIR